MVWDPRDLQDPQDSDGPLPTGRKAIEDLDDASAWPLAGVASRWESGMVQRVGLPLFVDTELQLVIDVERWNVGNVEVEEALPPGELQAFMRERAPQAILRDLHRPVQQFHVMPELREGTEWRTLDEVYRSARAALKIETGVPDVDLGTAVVRSEQTRRRTLLATRWEPFIPDDQPRVPVNLYGTFAGFGGTSPDFSSGGDEDE